MNGAKGSWERLDKQIEQALEKLNLEPLPNPRPSLIVRSCETLRIYSKTMFLIRARRPAYYALESLSSAVGSASTSPMSLLTSLDDPHLNQPFPKPESAVGNLQKTYCKVFLSRIVLAYQWLESADVVAAKKRLRANAAKSRRFGIPQASSNHPDDASTVDGDPLTPHLARLRVERDKRSASARLRGSHVLLSLTPNST